MAPQVAALVILTFRYRKSVSSTRALLTTSHGSRFLILPNGVHIQGPAPVAGNFRGFHNDAMYQGSLHSVPNTSVSHHTHACARAEDGTGRQGPTCVGTERSTLVRTVLPSAFPTPQTHHTPTRSTAPLGHTGSKTTRTRGSQLTGRQAHTTDTCRRSPQSPPKVSRPVLRVFSLCHPPPPMWLIL